MSFSRVGQASQSAPGGRCDEAGMRARPRGRTGVAGASGIAGNHEGVGNDAGGQGASFGLRLFVGKVFHVLFAELAQQKEGQTDGILVESGAGGKFAQRGGRVFGGRVHMAPGRGSPVQHGAATRMGAGRERLEQGRQTEVVHVVVPVVIDVLAAACLLPRAGQRP